MENCRPNPDAAVVGVVNIVMKVNYLKREDYVRTRILWEEIFTEDSPAFLDYYYRYKGSVNRIAAIEEEDTQAVIAMLHLNPYLVCTGRQIPLINYIVGVATSPEYRRRGLMRKLLERTLLDMYGERMPYTYLMPAAEKIYRPYGFRFVYDQLQARVSRAGIRPDNDYSVRPAAAGDTRRMAVFANQFLESRYDCYVHRTEQYYLEKIAEARSERGEMLLIYEDKTLRGICQYGRGREITVLEPLLEERHIKHLPFILSEYFGPDAAAICVNGIPESRDFLQNDYGYQACRQVPMIMARVVHLQSFCELFSGTGTFSLMVRFEDDVIRANNGLFDWQFANGRCTLTWAEDQDAEADCCMPVCSLVSFGFGYRSVRELISEKNIRATENGIAKLSRIHTFDRVFINELV